MDRIKDLVRLAKLNKLVKEKNYQQEWEEAGYQRSITEFHKPVTTQLKAGEEQLKKNYKAINNLSAIEYPSFETAIMDSKMKSDSESDEEKKSKKNSYTIDPDVDLDTKFLTKYKLPLPSQIFNKPDEIKEVLDKTENISKRLGNLKSQITRGADTAYTKSELNEDLAKIRQYKEKLKALDVTNLFKITGSGLISELEVLTNKLISGSKNKKMYNKIVSILDLLLKDGDLTNDEVKEYYDKFLYK
ncbi:hypothetical protein JTE90_023910 [Oedothorax gibbosus]|uniref:Uncharacterized protein n=1 Tax=Oedothorax gibbosus TaxID=931172 RepID=A0AAV6ULM0_9ARAC|nr:hypothetical protein JTE90_023910 [Oedothorax gibbosus]